MDAQRTPHSLHHARRRMARLLLTVFILTFLGARILVLLIMTRRIPDLFLHLGGTHVHHLNYGIVLLAIAGGCLLLLRPRGRAETIVAVMYAMGLALTFDEFGMWLHLGGSYWQRASFDAVTVVAGILALIAFLPPLRALRPRQLAIAGSIAIACAVFGRLLIETVQTTERHVAPALQRIEDAGPK